MVGAAPATLTRRVQVNGGGYITIDMPLIPAATRQQIPPIQQQAAASKPVTPRRLAPVATPRMQATPTGGQRISLSGTEDGPVILCRFAPPPPPPDPHPGELAPSTFRRRFDADSYILPNEISGEASQSRGWRQAKLAMKVSTAVPGNATEMLAELRDAILREEIFMRVIDLFRRYDYDGNGLVSREEFRRALPLLGLRGYAFSDMDLLFSSIDTDSSSSIEYTELYRLLRPGADVELAPELQKGAVAFEVRQKGASAAIRSSARDSRFEATPLRTPSVDEMRASLRRDRGRCIDAFRCLDRDGNGSVSKREFRAALPILGFTNDKSVADAVFGELDSNGSGMIEYEELNKKLRQGAGSSDELAPSLQPRAVSFQVREKGASAAIRGSARDSRFKSTPLLEPSVDEIRASLLRSRTRVIDAFRSLDEDANGRVSKREFRAALPILGFKNRKSVVDAIFEELDTNRSGTIEYAELHEELRRAAAGDSGRRFESAPPLVEPNVEEVRTSLQHSHARLIDAFRTLDEDANGRISKREFRAALPILGFKNRKSVADAIFAELDANRSGTIDYEELNEQLQRADGTPTPRQSSSLSDIRLALARESTRVLEMFKACDESEDGHIDKIEFRAVLPLLGFDSIGRRAIDELFDSFDLDNSGAVGFQELMTVLRYEMKMAKREAGVQ